MLIPQSEHSNLRRKSKTIGELREKIRCQALGNVGTCLLRLKVDAAVTPCLFSPVTHDPGRTKQILDRGLPLCSRHNDGFVALCASKKGNSSHGKQTSYCLLDLLADSPKDRQGPDSFVPPRCGRVRVVIVLCDKVLELEMRHQKESEPG